MRQRPIRLFLQIEMSSPTLTHSGKYALNSQMTFYIALRHYWSYAENKKLLSLEQNGRLADFAGYDVNKNSSFILGICLILGGLRLAVKFLFYIEIMQVPSREININKDFRDNVTNLLTNETLSHVFYQCALFY
jgi:hypothetical protein